jgi:hypothetical protein
MEELIIAADPVADPQGYQRELLALLGTSDPVEVLAATPATIEQWTMPLTAEVLDQRPAAGEWSVAELVGHLWDAEIAYGFRASGPGPAPGRQVSPGGRPSGRVRRRPGRAHRRCGHGHQRPARARQQNARARRRHGCARPRRGRARQQ